MSTRVKTDALVGLEARRRSELSEEEVAVRCGSLRARADKTAQPAGRFSHQVHGPTVRSQGKEHVITHILVIIHLSLEKTGRKAEVCQNQTSHSNVNLDSADFQHGEKLTAFFRSRYRVLRVTGIPERNAMMSLLA